MKNKLQTSYFPHLLMVPMKMSSLTLTVWGIIRKSLHLREGSRHGFLRRLSSSPQLCMVYLVAQMVKNPGLGRSPGEGNGYQLQYSCLENSMETRAWTATGHEVMKSWTNWATNTHTHIFHKCLLSLTLWKASNTTSIESVSRGWNSLIEVLQVGMWVSKWNKLFPGFIW